MTGFTRLEAFSRHTVRGVDLPVVGLQVECVLARHLFVLFYHRLISVMVRC